MIFRSNNTTSEYFLSDYVARAMAILLKTCDNNLIFSHVNVKIYGFSQWQKS